MAGFNKTIMFADNVDFTGADGQVGQILLDGQLLIGSTSAPNIRTGTLTAGTGITITPGAGSITISSTATGFVWNTSSTNVANMSPGNGYFLVSPGGALTLGLPATSVLGDTVRVSLKGATSFQITQAAGQQIQLGSNTTTLGVTGTLTSTAQGDSIELVCLTANTIWVVQSSQGNLTLA